MHPATQKKRRKNRIRNPNSNRLYCGYGYGHRAYFPFTQYWLLYSGVTARQAFLARIYAALNELSNSLRINSNKKAPGWGPHNKQSTLWGAIEGPFFGWPTGARFTAPRALPTPLKRRQANSQLIHRSKNQQKRPHKGAVFGWLRGPDLN